MSRVDRSRLPAPRPTPPFRFPSIHRRVLSNGVDVRAISHRNVPVVCVVLLIPGGTAADPAHRPGLAAFTADLLDEGSGGRSALEGAFDGGVGQAIGREQPRTHRFDVSAGVMAWQLRQPIDRALTRATEAGKQLAGEGCGVRADLVDAREDAHALARGIEQAIRTLELSVLAKYAFGLAQAFNGFYHRYSIINEERQDARLWRAAAVAYYRSQLTKALELMGATVPEKM